MFWPWVIWQHTTDLKEALSSKGPFWENLRPFKRIFKRIIHLRCHKLGSFPRIRLSKRFVIFSNLVWRFDFHLILFLLRTKFVFWLRQQDINVYKPKRVPPLHINISVRILNRRFLTLITLRLDPFFLFNNITSTILRIDSDLFVFYLILPKIPWRLFLKSNNITEARVSLFLTLFI